MKDIIDISDWQEGIDFDAVQQAGYEGVIIKMQEGTTETNCFETYVEECEARNIPWGVYCFTHATETGLAEAEAEACITYLGGRKPALGVWFDVDTDAPEVIAVGDVTPICSAFICKMNDAGYSCGVYAGYYTFRDNIHTDQLADYVPYWLSQYDPTCDFNEVSNGHLSCWQYSSTGYIGDTNVDLDYWYDE